MPYVITQLCVDCLDKGCVEVCPVDCIYVPVAQQAPAATSALPNMLYIHPTECISCGACEPECPWNAIYEDRELPALFHADVALNALCEEQPSRFAVAKPERDAQGRLVPKVKPSHADVAANKVKRGVR